MQAVIKKARECKTSSDLYAICEDLSHRLGDAQDRLRDAEMSLDKNWDTIAGCVTTVAYWRYLHDTVYEWAEDMNEYECHVSDEEWDQEMDAIRADEDRIQRAKEMERW